MTSGGPASTSSPTCWPPFPTPLPSGRRSPCPSASGPPATSSPSCTQRSFPRPSAERRPSGPGVGVEVAVRDPLLPRRRLGLGLGRLPGGFGRCRLARRLLLHRGQLG